MRKIYLETYADTYVHRADFRRGSSRKRGNGGMYSYFISIANIGSSDIY